MLCTQPIHFIRNTCTGKKLIKYLICLTLRGNNIGNERVFGKCHALNVKNNIIDYNRDFLFVLIFMLLNNQPSKGWLHAILL